MRLTVFRKKHAFLIFGLTTFSAMTPAMSQNLESINKPIYYTQNKALINISAATEGSAVIEAKDLINKIAEKGIGFLTNKDLSQEQRESEFRSLLNENFDMETIGRFALGRYWRTTSETEKQEYLKLFKEMIIKNYAKRFSEYDGEALKVVSAHQDKSSDTIVSSAIIPANGEKVQVDWRVRNKKGKNQVIDIIVEGVSMSLTYRSDFASVIQRGGGKIDALLMHLRKRPEQISK